MWRVLKCLEESLAHINGSMKEAPFGVVHALNSGDVVERSEEFYQLLSQYEGQRRSQGRKPVSTQSGGAVCGWKVAQTQCRHPDQKVMQWEHSADCMAFAPSRSSKVRGKEIVQNPIAQALVQDNPHITAKGLMDRLSSKSLEHQVRLSPFSCSVCRARVTQSASVCQSLSLSLWFSSSLVLSFSLSFTPVSLSCPFTHTHALALSLFLSLSLSLFLYPP